MIRNLVNKTLINTLRGNNLPFRISQYRCYGKEIKIFRKLYNFQCKQKIFKLLF